MPFLPFGLTRALCEQHSQQTSRSPRLFLGQPSPVCDFLVKVSVLGKYLIGFHRDHSIQRLLSPEFCRQSQCFSRHHLQSELGITEVAHDEMSFDHTAGDKSMCGRVYCCASQNGDE